MRKILKFSSLIALLVFGNNLTVAGEVQDTQRLQAMIGNVTLFVASGAVAGNDLLFTAAFSGGSVVLTDPCGNQISTGSLVHVCQGLTSRDTGNSDATSIQVNWPSANGLAGAAPVGIYTIKYTGTVGAAVSITSYSGGDLIPITSLGYGQYPLTISANTSGAQTPAPVPSSGQATPAPTATPSSGGCLVVHPSSGTLFFLIFVFIGVLISRVNHNTSLRKKCLKLLGK